MHHRISKIGVIALMAAVLFSTAACVMLPQQVNFTRGSITPEELAASDAASSAMSPDPVGSEPLDKVRQQLEAQLLCPTDEILAASSMRRQLTIAGIIGGRGKASPDGGIYYPVYADFSVFGHNVVGLEFNENENGESYAIYALVVGTPKAMTKLFKSRHIALKKYKGMTGFWAQRPFLQITGYRKADDLIKIGCGPRDAKLPALRRAWR